MVEYEIKHREQHYELYINGRFYCSTDTIEEAVEEMEAYSEVEE